MSDLPLIPGLADPWKWIQPRTDAELVKRLRQAAEYNVHERERENLCSCAASRLAAAVAGRDAIAERVRDLEHQRERVKSVLVWCETLQPNIRYGQHQYVTGHMEAKHACVEALRAAITYTGKTTP